MRSTGCPREDEVVTAALARVRPHDDEAVMEHARQCDICRGILDLVGLLREEHDGLHEGVSVPAAGQVWWRAAIRARLDTTHAAARPLAWLYGVLGACAVGLLIASVGLLWPTVQRATAWLVAPVWSTGLGLGEAATTIAGLARVSGLLMLGAAACIVLAPLALFLVLSED